MPSLHVFREAVEIHSTPRHRALEAYITCICTICARGDITLRCGWSLSQFPGSMARTKSHEVGSLIMSPHVSVRLPCIGSAAPVTGIVVYEKGSPTEWSTSYRNATHRPNECPQTGATPTPCRPREREAASVGYLAGKRTRLLQVHSLRMLRRIC